MSQIPVTISSGHISTPDTEQELEMGRKRMWRRRPQPETSRQPSPAQPSQCVQSLCAASTVFSAPCAS